jgi:hypothetical protein
MLDHHRYCSSGFLLRTSIPLGCDSHRRLPPTPFIAEDTRLVTCPQNGVNKVMLRQHPSAAEPNHRVRPARGSPFWLCDDQHQLSRLHVVCDELQLVSAAWQCRYRSNI